MINFGAIRLFQLMDDSMGEAEEIGILHINGPLELPGVGDTLIINDTLYRVLERQRRTRTSKTEVNGPHYVILPGVDLILEYENPVA